MTKRRGRKRRGGEDGKWKKNNCVKVQKLTQAEQRNVSC